MNAALATRAIATCPSWCQEPAGHRDADDECEKDLSLRTHVGRIGRFEIARTEKTAVLGRPYVDLILNLMGPEVETPAELRQLAADALKAAEWFESQQ